MARMSDWRIDLARHTKSAALYFRKYARYSEQWDHDHCEACTATFIESGPAGTLTEGYATADNYRWICSDCFRDLKDEMGWTLAD
jgi:SRSO17 transposase